MAKNWTSAATALLNALANYTVPLRKTADESLEQIGANSWPARYDAKSGWWYAAHDGPVSAGVTINNAAARFVPFRLHMLITVTQLAARITTAAASGNMKLAIYAHDPATGYPTGTPIAETGAMSTGTTGMVSAALAGSNVTLQPGLIYWAAIMVDATGSSAVFQVPTAASWPAAHLIGSATLADHAGAGGASEKGIGLYTTTVPYGSWGSVTSASWTKGNNASGQCGPALYLKAA